MSSLTCKRRIRDRQSRKRSRPSHRESRYYSAKRIMSPPKTSVLGARRTLRLAVLFLNARSGILWSLAVCQCRRRDVARTVHDMVCSRTSEPRTIRRIGRRVLGLRTESRCTHDRVSFRGMNFSGSFRARKDCSRFPPASGGAVGGRCLGRLLYNLVTL